MKQYVAAKAERIELTLCENIAFSGGEIIPDRPPFVAPPKMTSDIQPFCMDCVGLGVPKKRKAFRLPAGLPISRGTPRKQHTYTEYRVV